MRILGGNLFRHIREFADRILGVGGAQMGVTTRYHFAVVADDPKSIIWSLAISTRPQYFVVQFKLAVVKLNEVWNAQVRTQKGESVRGFNQIDAG